MPAFRSRFYAYGPRASESSSSQTKPGKEQSKSSFIGSVLDTAAKIRVPHNWFASFYALSVGCSLLWVTAIFRNGATIESTDRAPVEPGAMTLDQIMVSWTLFFAHASRRLYECITLPSSSSSQMWIGHWAMGIAFYVSMSLAVWIEGLCEYLIQIT